MSRGCARCARLQLRPTKWRGGPLRFGARHTSTHVGRLARWRSLRRARCVGASRPCASRVVAGRRSRLGSAGWLASRASPCSTLCRYRASPSLPGASTPVESRVEPLTVADTETCTPLLRQTGGPSGAAAETVTTAWPGQSLPAVGRAPKAHMAHPRCTSAHLRKLRDSPWPSASLASALGAACPQGRSSRLRRRVHHWCARSAGTPHRRHRPVSQGETLRHPRTRRAQLAPGPGGCRVWRDRTTSAQRRRDTPDPGWRSPSTARAKRRESACVRPERAGHLRGCLTDVRPQSIVRSWYGGPPPPTREEERDTGDPFCRAGRPSHKRPQSPGAFPCVLTYRSTHHRNRRVNGADTSEPSERWVYGAKAGICGSTVSMHPEALHKGWVTARPGPLERVAAHGGGSGRGRAWKGATVGGRVAMNGSLSPLTSGVPPRWSWHRSLEARRARDRSRRRTHDLGDKLVSAHRGRDAVGAAYRDLHARPAASPDLVQSRTRRHDRHRAQRAGHRS